MTSTMEDEKRKKKQSFDGRPRRAKFLYRPAIATFDGEAARVYPRNHPPSFWFSSTAPAPSLSSRHELTISIISRFPLFEYLINFFYSVQDRICQSDRTEWRPRPSKAHFMDRRSRFGPVDRRSVGLCGTLLTRPRSLSHVFSLFLASSDSAPLFFR